MLVGTIEKIFSTNFIKANRKCSLSLHYHDDHSYLYVKKDRFFKLRHITTYLGITFVKEAYQKVSRKMKGVKLHQMESLMIFQLIIVQMKMMIYLILMII